MFVRLILPALLSLACTHAIAFDFVLRGGVFPALTPWLGSLHVETDSFADGVYTGSNLRSFEFESNIFTYPGGLTYDVPPAVRLLDGQVAEITVSGFGGSFIESQSFSIDGFTASYVVRAFKIGNVINASGTLVAVPEPATFALFLSGLALIVAVKRSRTLRRSLRIVRSD
jgi:hypothetical protein